MTIVGRSDPAKVMKKLVLSTPSPELVDAYLFEIAKGYGVGWSPPAALKEDVGPKEDERDAKVCPIFFRSHPFHPLIYTNVINRTWTRKRTRRTCWTM